MIEEKDQLIQQRCRIDKLRQFIDMSMNLKNATYVHERYGRSSNTN
jgi:hypothetical protein